MLFDPLLHGYGFSGLRNAISLITDDITDGVGFEVLRTLAAKQTGFMPGSTEAKEAAALGPTSFDPEGYVRQAVSELMIRDLRERMQRRRAPSDWRTALWTAASDTDLDHTAWGVANSLAANTRLMETVLSRSEGQYRGGVIRLTEKAAYLCGPNYALTIGLVSETKKYSSRLRNSETAWSPFITDEGMDAAHGSRYGGSGDLKSVTVTKASSAAGALQRLMGKHFKVTFVNVDPGVAKAA